MVCLQEGHAAAPSRAPPCLTGETWELSLAEHRLVAVWQPCPGRGRLGAVPSPMP